MKQTIAQQIKWISRPMVTWKFKGKNGKQIYFEGSKGYWAKRECDSQGNEIYYENSNGEIVDNRPKPCENKEIVIEGIKYKLVKA